MLAVEIFSIAKRFDGPCEQSLLGKIEGDSACRVGLMEMIHRITQQIRLKTKLCFLLPSLFYAKKNAFVKLKKRVKMLSYCVVSLVVS